MSVPANDYDNPIDVQGFTTEHAAAAIVLGAMVALWAIRRGFRGINIAGAGVRVG